MNLSKRLLKNNLYTSVILSEAKNLAARPFASLRVTIPERALASQLVQSICKVYFLWPQSFTSGCQLDLVAVGIFEKGDGVATASMLHRAWLAHDLNSFSAKFVAGFVNVRHA
jgi:hypothetical protein